MKISLQITFPANGSFRKYPARTDSVCMIGYLFNFEFRHHLIYNLNIDTYLLGRIAECLCRCIPRPIESCTIEAGVFILFLFEQLRKYLIIKNLSVFV